MRKFLERSVMCLAMVFGLSIAAFAQKDGPKKPPPKDPPPVVTPQPKPPPQNPPRDDNKPKKPSAQIIFVRQD